MQLVMLLSVVLSTIVGTYVGMRLLRLARKTGQRPELLVGVSLVSYAAVAQVGLLVFVALGTDVAVLTRMSLAAVRIGAYVVTLGTLAAFTWQAFGRSSAWRRNLAMGIGAVAALGGGLMLQGVWVNVHGGPKLPPEKQVLMNVCFAVTYVWMACEALRYHGLMRRRMALGLADAVVTNRFLLWGAGAAASALLVATLFVLSLAGLGAATGNPVSSLLVSLTGLLNTAVWALTFTPPESYRRWVRAHASPMEPAHG